MSIYELTPEYDARKSFYGKAFVKIDGNTERLYSYETEVGKMVDGKVEYVDTGWSQTTNRHIREWLRQHDFKPEDYMKAR